MASRQTSCQARRQNAEQAVDHDTLLGMLSRFKFVAIRDQLDTLLDEAARRELTLREALAFLCQRKVARKDERRMPWYETCRSRLFGSKLRTSPPRPARASPSGPC